MLPGSGFCRLNFCAYVSQTVMVEVLASARGEGAPPFFREKAGFITQSPELVRPVRLVGPGPGHLSGPGPGPGPVPAVSGRLWLCSGLGPGHSLACSELRINGVTFFSIVSKICSTMILFSSNLFSFFKCLTCQFGSTYVLLGETVYGQGGS